MNPEAVDHDDPRDAYPVTVESQQTAVGSGGLLDTLSALLTAMRPKQWTKNLLVFAALVFDHQLDNVGHFALVFGAFICFCLASSSTYLVNDVMDRESDRLHPKKRHRPIASGKLSERTALVAAAVAFLTSVGVGFLLRPAFAGVILLYIVLIVAYSLSLKHMVILDAFTISAGFVLRAAGGAVVLDVPISPWLYVCTVLLSLFLAFGKRRAELNLLEDSAAEHRRNLDEYTVPLLDQLILITTAATVMAYSLYTFTADNLPENHSMMLTIPFVLYGVFRYLFLIYARGEGGAPEQVLLSDRPLLVSVMLWGLAAVAIVYQPI